MINPLVSVIIPVHNVEDYLVPCIESLLSQTLESIELLFVDDCSTDSCPQILDSYQKDNPTKVRVLQTPENVRAGGARNYGVREARGDYIGFVDGDDYVAPTMFSDLLNKAIETGADTIFCQYSAVAEGKYPAAIGDESLSPLIRWDNSLLRYDNVVLDDDGRCDLIAYPIGGVYCGLYSRKYLERASVTFPEKMRYDDNYWGSLIRPYVDKVAFVPKIAYYFVQRPNSTSRTPTREAILERREIENRLLADAKTRGVFHTHYYAWEYIYIFRCTENTAKTLLSLPQVEYSDIKELVTALSREFPRWRNNPYYRRRSSTSRFACWLALSYPRCYRLFKKLM